MDDDGKKPEGEPAETARDAAQEEGARLREVSEEELKQILAAHKTWLERGEEKGEQADLSRTDLQGVDFSGTNLRKANLQEANLRGANLQGANLRKANLRDADLSDAKLSDVTGLLADKLAGANLSNAKLPEDIAAFDGLAGVEETSRIARPIFIGLLAGCVYSWLTIATTTDARLLTNSASSPLPIIGTEIPIAGFYWVAPILLLGVYLYLHLYLQRLWEGLADLPAVFPDGKPLNKKVYPWLLSGLVRAHFKLLKGKRTLLSRLENGAAIFLAWWIVPVTVLVFWGRYLPRHEWIGTGLHIVLLVVSVGSAILLHRHAAATLRRDVAAFRWRRLWSDCRTYQGTVALGRGVVFVLVSLGAIEGEARRDAISGGPVVLGGIATWVPFAFDRVGYRTFANLREADVSTKPENWWTAKVEERFDVIQGATLHGRDLRHADATKAFLVKADLSSANLREANLFGANLRKANLGGADLKGADLAGANLREANLFGANLKGAKLGGANFREANLSGANLPKANLGGANLQEANLDDANLQEANLFGANLREANLAGANLRGANLVFASLQEANLRGANLQRAGLSFANLEGADLTEAKGLTREQLDEVCGDDGTKLPDYLADYQMKPCSKPEEPPSN